MLDSIAAGLNPQVAYAAENLDQDITLSVLANTVSCKPWLVLKQVCRYLSLWYLHSDLTSTCLTDLGLDSSGVRCYWYCC